MFTDRFIQTLQDKQLTAYKIAKETGISQGLMNEYKNGIKLPTLQNLLKIADYLDVSIDYLMGRTDDPQKEKSPISEALSEQEQIHALSIHLYELMIKLGVVEPGQDLTPGQIQILYEFGRDFIRGAQDRQE